MIGRAPSSRAAAAEALRRRQVQERLARAMFYGARGYNTEDVERLQRDYILFRDAGKLAELAQQMSRPKTSLVKKARELGLTDKLAPRVYMRTWKGMPEETAQVIWADFKASALGLGMYCKRKGYDDVGFSRTMREHFADEWEHVIEVKAPKQSMYRLGRQFEYRTRDHLKKLGYFVMRSPASRSPLDLVAIRKGAVLFIQCKRGGQLGVGEWNEVFDLAESVDAIPLLAETSTGRGGACYWRLLSRKDASRRRQPHEPFDPAGSGPRVIVPPEIEAAA